MLHVRLGCEDGLGTNGSQSWISESKTSLQTLGKRNETKLICFVLLVTVPIAVVFNLVVTRADLSYFCGRCSSLWFEKTPAVCEEARLSFVKSTELLSGLFFHSL